MRGLSLLICGALIAATTVVVVRGRVNQVEAHESASAPVEPPGDPRAVASVRIDGDSLPLATLEDALTTRVGALLREDDLTRDRAALIAALVARGHLAATVTDVQTTWRADGAHVVFAVAAGGAYRVGTVTVEGPLARRFPELAEVPTMLAGQVWGAERAAANQAGLRDWLAHRRARAEIAVATSIDHARQTVDVTFTATPPR